MEDALDFSLIDDYLALDPYFCPIPEEDSFDAFFLYTAISILENAFDEFALGDELAITVFIWKVRKVSFPVCCC